MQILGGASESVPTVSVAGTLSPSALMLTAVNGSTSAVVYLSVPGPLAAFARLVGSALARSTPGGAHWSTLAVAGGAGTTTPPASEAATKAWTSRIQSNVAALADPPPGSAQSERNRRRT